jgi:DNA-binding NarL/FixJ family response regulator
VRGGLRFPVVMLIPASEAGRRTDPRLASLSPRELEIATSLADGRTKKEIAERLGVSFSTVNTITSRIYRKLGVTRRASLVNAMRG